MEPQTKSNGAMLGLVIIIIILVAGGVYVWKSNQKAMDEQKQQTEGLSAKDSADLDSLQADAATTDANVGVDVSTVK